MHSEIRKSTDGDLEWIFGKMQEAYTSQEKPTFDDLVGFVGALDGWSIFKTRPNPVTQPNEGSYLAFEHNPKEDHLGLQYILTGILSVFYDEKRRGIRRPGYTAFQSGRNASKVLGDIPCNSLR